MLHDLTTTVVFLSMVIAPAFLSMRSGPTE